jgi:hypothetical protein
VEFTARGCPAQNGAHEQQHRVLKADTARLAAPNMQAQQRRFDRWRRDYNQRRPHEALGQQVPAGRYRLGHKRSVRARPAAPHARAIAVRRVHPNGEILWEGRRRFVGDAVAGHPVGLYRLMAGVWSVRFLRLELGHLHPADAGAMRPARAQSPATPKL